MSITLVNRSCKGAVASLGLATMLLGSVPRPGECFEPHYPANEQLRTMIREVRDRQAVRPPASLETHVREALRSINQVEGRADAVAAARLTSELRIAWQELERARAVGALGYREFDDEKFSSAESKLEAIAAQFRGARAALPTDGHQAVAQALADVQALSRAARVAVPGILGDDVVLIRAKRQKLLLKEPRGDESLSPPTQNTDTGSPR